MKYEDKCTVQKLADISGYELPANMQNFTQKYLTEVKIFQSFFWRGATFFETPCCIMLVKITWSFEGRGNVPPALPLDPPLLVPICSTVGSFFCIILCSQEFVLLTIYK